MTSSFPSLAVVASWSRRHLQSRATALSLSGIVLLLSPSLEPAQAQAVRGPRVKLVGGGSLPAGYSSVLAGNNDGSTGPVDIGFKLSYGGTSWTQLFVNNNGNLTFGASLSTVSSSALHGATGLPIIAPFLADVDTRSFAARDLGGAPRPAGLGLASYELFASGSGLSAEFGNRSVFSATWSDVGFFSLGTELTNIFQVNLIERSDVGNGQGNFDIEFNYDRIQWDAGATSAAAGGATVAGISNGSGLPGTYRELAGSGTNGALVDGGPHALTSRKLGSSVLGRYVFHVRNGGSDAQGLKQDNPLLPSVITPGNPEAGIAPIYQFNDAISGRWYDPPDTYGYDYVGLSGTTFTTAGLPTGFLNPFNIFTGAGFGNFLGSFLGGTFVDFVALTGGAVDAFRLTGISPLVESIDVNAFPIFLTFSQPTGNTFTLQPLLQPPTTVPEPGTYALVAAGLIALVGVQRRTRRPLVA